MSIKSQMTALADAVRSKSGATGKLSIAGMTDAVNSIAAGGGSGVSDEYYRCEVVYGPIRSNGVIVSGAGTEVVNGYYFPTGELTEQGYPIYKHETYNFYYLYKNAVFCIIPTLDTVELYGYYHAPLAKPNNWNVGPMGAEPAPTVTRSEITGDANEPETWSGFKAVWSDADGYSFEEKLTTGLSYGTGFTPFIGNVYNSDATVVVSALYQKVSKRSVLKLVSPRDSSGIGGTYKQVAGTEYGTKECRWQYMNNSYPTRNILWGTPMQSGSYGDDNYVGIEGWHVCDGVDEHKVWLGSGQFPAAPVHWDPNSTLTETEEDWDLS